MKKWAISLLALLLAAPVHAEEKTFGGFSGSTTVPAPTISGQILGTDGLTAMWMTLAGGNGNCYLQYNGPGSYSLICPNFGSGGGGGGQVPGGPPQFIGYSSTDINEAVTSVGDVTYQRTAPNTYTSTVNSIGGIPGPFLTANNPAFTGILTGPTINITGNGSTLGTTNISSLTVSGTLNGASVVLQGILNFGAAGALYFNGIPMGGVCGPNLFVSSIDAKGVPTCTEPTGGGPWLPVNNPNFTGNLTGPGFLAGATGINTSGNLSVGSGTSNITLNGNISTDSTLGSGNALVVNVRGLPMLRVDAATGVVQLSTITGTGSTSAVAFQIDANGNVLLNRDATLPLGATTLQQVQALVAAGTWLPVNNPTFTGLLTGPNATLTGSLGIGVAAPSNVGTLLQMTSNGNQPTAVGLTNTGTGANADSTYYIGNDLAHYAAFQLTNTGFTAAGPEVLGDTMVLGTSAANGIVFNVAPTTVNEGYLWWQGGTKIMSLTGFGGVDGQATGLSVSAPNPGKGSYAGVYVGNDLPGHYAVMQLNSSTNTDNGCSDCAIFQTQSAGGTHINGLQGNLYEYSNQIYLDVNTAGVITDAVLLNSGGMFVAAASAVGPVFNSIYFGLAAPYLGAIAVTTGNFVTASQAHSNGSFWVADAAVAVLENLSSQSGGIAFYSDSGLTVGEQYTPTIIADISPTVGLDIPNMTTGDGGVVIRGNVNSNIGIITQNVNTNAAANSSIFLQSSDHTLQLAQLSSNWTANPFFPIDSSIIMTDALNLYVGSYSAASTLNFNLGGALFGRFVNQNPIIQGLELPGFAGPLPNFMASALHIGNAYMGAYGWAGLDITGASYFDNNVGYWRSDGGAGSGAALLSLNTGCITMYNTAPVSSGAAINWLQMAIWCGSGEEVGHLSNMKSERIPTVSSGVLVADSRDSFGWVTKVMGGQTTITFAEPFISQSNCSLTASGTPYTWFNADQDTKHSTFVCVVPWTGEQCPDDVTVEYHCFGQTGKDGPQLIGKR